jgi:protein phosphatase 1 regulatory subunit 7
MPSIVLDGVEVSSCSLTQWSYRARCCEFLVPVTAEKVEEALAAYERLGAAGKCQGLRVSGIADLSFLDRYPDLLYLEVLEQKRVATKHLEALGNLRGLRLETPGAGIDFAWFPELEVFSGDWHQDNCNLARARELRRLHVWQFKPRSRDLDDVAGVPRLEALHLVQTTVESLAGIETLEDLRYLEMAYAPKLASLNALARPGVEVRELAIEKAKAIADYAPVAAIKRLRRLRLSSCAAMPDLKWTAGMDDLDFFSFVETDVADGDLSPLLNLPKLRYAGTMDKRHYNYRFKDLNELLAQRNT